MFAQLVTARNVDDHTYYAVGANLLLLAPVPYHLPPDVTILAPAMLLAAPHWPHSKCLVVPFGFSVVAQQIRFMNSSSEREKQTNHHVLLIFSFFSNLWNIYRCLSEEL